MADVAISQLTQRQPSDTALVPYSEGGTTYSASVTQVVSLASSIPAGGIILWSGAANAIPSGWLLCNGANGTPNLVDRFVVGAGVTTPAVGTTGGSKDAIVVSHSHTASDSGHAHAMIGVSSSRGKQPALLGVLDSSLFSSTTNANRGNSQIGAANITVAAAGQSGTNANLPPYYALCYIMKE
jgi:microcystin-dependent protein